MNKIILLAPRECWHTTDLCSLERYEYYSYTVIYDTPPFLSRHFYSNLLISKYITYELLQRIWRILSLPFHFVYLFIRLFPRRSSVIHCHGLYSLVIGFLVFLPFKRVVFTPQGSDILVLPYKFFLVRYFLSCVLPRLSAITADSKLILDSCLQFSSIDPIKLYKIQNGIDFENLSVNPSSKIIKYDICWPRGFSSIYRFGYFVSILKELSSVSTRPLNICIIGAFGSPSNINDLLNYPNLHVVFLPRLSQVDFYNTLSESKLIISIPVSDSSPRTVYESIFLKRSLFLSPLPCFDWIEDFVDFPFAFYTGNIQFDASQIFSLLENFPVAYDPPASFVEQLSYPLIAKAFNQVFLSAR